MSTRNTQRRVTPQVNSKTIPVPNTTARPSSKVRKTAAAVDTRQSALNLPVEGHRVLASLALLAMLVMSLAPATGAAAPVNPAVFLTPNIDGSGSIPQDIVLGTGSMNGYTAIFPYESLAERASRNAQSVWPPAGDVLSSDPTSLQTRRAIVGSLYASTTGDVNTQTRDTGLPLNPTHDELQALQDNYTQMLGINDQADKGSNGLGVTELLYSLEIPSSGWAAIDQDSLTGFVQAYIQTPETWQFTYNWALNNLMMGNYGAATEGMKDVSNDALKDNNTWPLFWEGVAAMRSGDPASAITIFNTAINTQPQAGAGAANTANIQTVQNDAREGLADAEWANRNPAQAYDAYRSMLKLGAPVAVYNKWLQLGLAQHSYELLAADIKDLYETAGSSLESTLTARMHHDRARLLSFLGRQDEALAEYRQAAGMVQNEGSLFASYAEALENAGDHSGALSQAQQAITYAGKDPSVADLTSVAGTAVMTNTDPTARQNAQTILDATLVRARAWANSGHQDLVDQLAGQIVSPIAGRPQAEGGLLNLYAGFTYEAAGRMDKAATAYQNAWNLLKGLPSGQQGRAAALAGWARSSAATGGAAAGLAVLKNAGYDPAAPKNTIASDADAPDILTEGSVLLAANNQKKEAANTLRIAAVVQNVGNARNYGGVGRPIWTANGTFVPAQGIQTVGDALRNLGDNSGLTALRYREAYSLQPALASAFNNLGVLYQQNGNSNLARFYLQSSATVSPGYIWGQQNLAAFSYEQGPTSLLTGEQAQAQVVKAAGPSAASWGYELRPDERGGLPGPVAPTSDFLSRLPAILLVLLLLAHTLIGRNRAQEDSTTRRDVALPARGVLGRLEQAVNSAAKSMLPGLAKPRGGASGVLMAIWLPVLIGMLALAWHAGHGWLAVALTYLPVALVATLIAFGANELVQQIAARRSGGETLHHTSPFGVLLGIVGIPFGLMYGWGATTRVQINGNSSAEHRANRGNTAVALAEEAEIEAEADSGTPVAPGAANVGTSRLVSVPATGPLARLGLGTAATIMFAGMLANAALALIFGIGYLLSGWPSLRLAMLASLLVLTFTAVSEPPADGWTLYRRNPALWLGVFLLGALGSVMLIAGIM